ncbi:hypothetical protein [Microbacterium sediminis]|uniref:Uncharacterized protein n=1 Tax=Microbacterium sediminis TaxID=904291 RepID=A0A1B9N872_9MICO|nr:hypothetical protein [Microbacterium sediminis]OCG72801.1 hypothetical protein A7J15_09815 [Microbacterium sediminis]QBR73525.1 4-phosphopantetheinyl transferase [Microbacterium sediminis]
MRRIGEVLVAHAEASADRSASADALLGALIARLAPGADARVGRRCAVCGGTDHGAPVALGAPVVLSAAYAGGLVVAAGAPSARVSAVGIDAEPGAAGTILTELSNLVDPPPSLREWTRIEAALKADGRGLRVPPDAVRLDGDAARVPGRADPIALIDVPSPAGLVVSLAVAARPPRATR